MKRPLFAALALVWVCVPVASAQSLDWKMFNSTELGFSVRFPGTPTSNPPDVEKQSDGSVKSKSWIFQLQAPNLICLAGVTEYTFSFNADDELAADQTNFLKAIDGKLVTSRRAEYISGSNKLPELIFTFEFPKLDYIGRANVIVQGNRTYMTVFAFAKGTEYSTAMDTFLDSLELSRPN